MAKLENSLEKYSVVFLSAGRGERIGQIGKKKPKCLSTELLAQEEFSDNF